MADDITGVHVLITETAIKNEQSSQIRWYEIDRLISPDSIILNIEKVEYEGDHGSAALVTCDGLKHAGPRSVDI